MTFLTMAGAALALLAAIATGGTARANPADAVPPPAQESAQQRAQRFTEWRAAHPDDARHVRRAIRQTRKLVTRYQGKADERTIDPATAQPIIFRTQDSGAVLWECANCPQMVIVPAGRFTIGSPDDEPARGKDEAPRRVVTLAYPLAVSRFEITRGEYKAFLQATGHPVSGGCITDRIHQGDWQPEPNTNLHDPGYSQTDNHPVVCVSWNDAQAFIAWLNTQTDGGYRLLSESEWEYVARAGSTSVYPWGDDPASGCGDANTADATMLDKYSDHPDKYPADKYPGFTMATCRDGALKTAPVGSYLPNAFGLYDVIGNAGDWVQDCATMNYDTLPADGEADVSGDCTRHMTRGGSWGTMVKDYRSANRMRYEAGAVDDSLGFRVARTLK